MRSFSTLFESLVLEGSGDLLAMRGAASLCRLHFSITNLNTLILEDQDQ